MAQHQELADAVFFAANTLTKTAKTLRATQISLRRGDLADEKQVTDALAEAQEALDKLYVLKPRIVEPPAYARHWDNFYE